MDKPENIRVVVEERSLRHVRLYFAPGEPWRIREGGSKGVYIRPDYTSVTYEDGTLQSVSLAGRHCRKNGELVGTGRPQDYFTWGGKHMQPAPEWLAEALAEQAPGAVVTTWRECEGHV